MNKLLTIIVTYNGMKWLKHCLSSVRESDIHSDLFIVDNGSTDGSIQYIKDNYPEAVLIESKENLGFGKANNQGFRYAVEHGYDYVYLLNQDAWIEKDTFSKMIAVSKDNPEYGILSPLQVNRENTKLDFNFNKLIPLDYISDILCMQPLKEVYATDSTMAAHWLIPVEKLKIIGGFSPAFQHYGEDGNLAQRCLYKGFKNGIVPSTKGVHDRENRPVSREKIKYMNYVDILIFLNDLRIKNRLIRFLFILIRRTAHPSTFRFNYIFKSIGAYFSSKKYRREYMQEGAYL